MTTRSRVSLARVWAAAATVFVVAMLASRALSHRPTPWPAYWTGLVGLRGVVATGALLWLALMVFPFL